MSRSNRRFRFVLLAPMVALVALVTAGCGEPADDRVPGPNMKTGFDFEPAATISISGNGADVNDIEVRPGQTIEITNDAARDIRLKGDGFDTGVMLDGESTIVAFIELGEVELIQTLGGGTTIRVAVVSGEPES